MIIIMQCCKPAGNILNEVIEITCSQSNGLLAIRENVFTFPKQTVFQDTEKPEQLSCQVSPEKVAIKHIIVNDKAM